MSFHPLSPVFLEFSTEYTMPSGPTTRPLCTSYSDAGAALGMYVQGLGCCPLHWTVPEPGRCNGSLTGGGVPGTRSAGNGLLPLLTDGAGITSPGFTGWSQRAAGAGQVRI